MWIKYCSQTGECILHAGYLRLQTHTQNMQHLLLLHRNNGYSKETECYVYKYIAVLVSRTVPIEIFSSSTNIWLIIGYLLQRYSRKNV